MKLELKRYYHQLLYIIFIFFTSAFVGGILETCYTYITLGRVSLSGFMYGPWRPIYGWGAVIIYLTTRKVNKNFFVTFLSCSFICSIFEYISSVVLEILFNKRWWNYYGMFLNIDGRICLRISIIWGIVGVIFVKLIEPKLNKSFNKVDIARMTVYLLFTFIIYKADGFYSFIKHLR